MSPDQFDPFADGSAVEVTDKPVAGEFDPFADGSAETKTPTIHETDSSESQGLGDNWRNLYAGLDTLDSRLGPDQQAAFKRLDSLSDNSKMARAQAINQAYVQSITKDLPHSLLERNWPAFRDATANQLGLSGKDISETQLYSAISKQFADNEPKDGPGEVKAWTFSDALSSDIHAIPKKLGAFWESINKPVQKIPDAPDDLPDNPAMGLSNPALIGGVYNAIKPLIEGLESPLGIATLGFGTELHAAAKTYPLAKAVVVSMSGVFTGFMGYGAAKSAINAPKVLRDPSASFQDKVTAVAAPVAESAATLMGALGMALEMFPKAEGAKVVKELEGKNPVEAADVLRKEAEASEVPKHAEKLNEAADQMEKLATEKQWEEFNQPLKDKMAESDELAGEPRNVGEEVPMDRMDEVPDILKPQKTAREDGLIGIKNASIDAELESMGMEKGERGDSITWKEENRKAAALEETDPAAGRKVIERLKESGRAPNPDEVVLALREVNRLRLERDAAESEFNAMEQDGDQAQRMDARVRRNEARDAFKESADVLAKAKTLQGQAFGALRLMMKEDYSLAGVERRVSQVPEAARNEILEIQKRYAESLKRLEEHEANLKRAAAEPQRIAPPKKQSNRVREFISAQADAARARIKARLAEGRSMSGVDPAELADHVIVGAEYIARGVDKIGAWSTAMLNEFGEAIRPHLEEIFRQSIEARDQASKLQAYKKRTLTANEKLQEKVDTGDLSTKERKKIQLDPEAIKLRAENQRLKDLIDTKIKAEELKNRSPLEKIADGFLRLRKVGLISGMKTLGKVGVAGQTRIGMTLADTASGALLNKLPVLRDIAEGAPREGGKSGSTAANTAVGYVKGWKHAIDQAWNVLKYGKTDVEVLEGSERGNVSALNYLVNTHALAKLPAFAQEYEISLRERTAYELKQGTDMTNPINQMRVNNEAVQDGLRAKFSQDNFVTKRFNMLVRALENSKEHQTTGKVIAGVLQFLFPIIKIPSNFFAEAASYTNLGLGLPRAAVKTIEAMRTGVEKLTPEQSDSIMRHWKKGSLGAGLMLLGYYWRDDIGGYYQPGKKDPKKPEFGGAKLFGNDVPRWMIHMPILEAMHFGATVGHVLDRVNHKTGEKEEVSEAVLAGVTGMLDEIPYVQSAKTVSQVMEHDGRGKYARGELVKGALVPRLVSEIAEFADKDRKGETVKRKPDSVLQHVETGIPGLRENVKKKDSGATLR